MPAVRYPRTPSQRGIALAVLGLPALWPIAQAGSLHGQLWPLVGVALVLLAAIAEAAPRAALRKLVAAIALILPLLAIAKVGSGSMASVVAWLGAALVGSVALNDAASLALRRALAMALLVAGLLQLMPALAAMAGGWLSAFMAALPALLLGLWALLRAPQGGSRHYHERLPLAALQLQAGIGLLVMSGWLLGVWQVVQGGTGYVPMQFNTALCHLLSAVAAWTMLRGHGRLAAALLLPLLAICLPTLIVEFVGVDLGIDQLLFTHPLSVEGVPPGRMAPNSAIAFLVGAVGVVLLARSREQRGLWAGVWSAGFFVSLSALIVIAGYLLDVPAARGWGSQTPMALMTALAFAAHGAALLLSGRDDSTRRSHQTIWLPAMVFGGALVLALQLGIAVNQQRNALVDGSAALQADSEARSLIAGVQLRADALRRFADRLGGFDDRSAADLFDRDSRAYLADFPSIDALLWVDSQLQVRRQVIRPGARLSQPEFTRRLNAASQNVFRRVQVDGIPLLSEPLDWRTDGPGALLVLPLRGGAQQGGFLVAGIGYAPLLAHVLEGNAGQTLQVRQEDTLLHRLGEPASGAATASRQIELLGRRWTLDLWAPRPPALDRITLALLAASIVAGAWLALALRFAGLARQRAEQAEANRSALEQQLIEGERMRSALDQSERDLAGVLESISDAFYLLDSQWRYVFVNAEAARLQGRSRAELLGHTPWELFPESAQMIRPHFERAVRENTPYIDEVHYPPFDAWFEIRAYPHRRGLAVYFRDITVAKRHALEQAKRRAEAERAQRLASLGSWEFTLASNTLVWSPQTAAIFGLPEGYQPKGVDDLMARVHPDDRVLLRASQLRANVGAADIDVEYRILRPDGELRHVHELGTLLRDAQGEPMLVTGAIQDITERKRTEESLRRSDTLLRIAGRAARLGAWSYQLGADHIELSDEACAIHELPPGSTPSLDAALQFYPQHERERMRTLVNDCARHGAPYDVEVEMCTASGRPLWVRAIGEAVRDGDGRIVRLQGAVQDISERKQAERALENERRFLRALLENLAEGVVACDAEGRLSTFNRATRQFHGLPEARLPQAEWARHYSLFHLDRRPLQADEVPLARALRGEAVVDVEMLIAPAGGSERIVVCNGQRIVDEQGLVLGAVVAMHDITASKRAARFEAGQRDVLAGIAARQPLPDSLAAICRLHEQQFPGSLCSVLLLDDSGKHLLGGVAPSLPPEYLRLLHGEAIGPRAGSCGTAAYTRQRVVVPDIAHDPLWADYAEAALAFGLCACWSTPVTSSDGRVVATLAVYYREVRAPDDNELAASEGLAAMAAIAIEQGLAFRQLSLSEQRFRSLFDEHPDAVYAMDLAGRFTACNAGFERLSGRGAERVIGTFFDDIIAPMQRAFVRQQFTAAARGEARTFELRVVTASGSSTELRSSNLPIVVDGEVVGVFGVAHDIGPLRQRERELALALQQAEAASQRLRRLSAASLAVAGAGSETAIASEVAQQLATVLPCSDVLLRAADGSPLASAGSPLPPWPTPASLTSAQVLTGSALQRCDETLSAAASWLGLPLFGNADRRLGQIELRRLEAPAFGDDEQVIAQQFAQLAAGILERSQLISRLRERDRFFEMAGELFCIFEPARGRFLQVNPAFVRLLGYSEVDLLSRHYTEFVHPADRPSSHQAAAQVREGIPVQEFANRYVCADGSLRWLEWTTVSDDNGHAFCVARDITARRRAEAALQQAFDDLRVRNRELQDFAFVASHDLQEPLRKIRAFSDRLLARYSEALDEQGRDYLSRSGQAAARMQVLIDDLLAYSRVNSRGKPFGEVDLGQLVRSVLDDLEARLEASGGKVEVGPLPRIEADATQLRQMLQNLIANALKFRAPERSPLVRIHAEPRTLEGDRPGWALVIEDNGIGFEQKYAERIFGPFQRLHGRQEYEGTGIGLAIVRRIVERHRGTVEAEGQPGEGARFVVILPERQPGSPLEGGSVLQAAS